MTRSTPQLAHTTLLLLLAPWPVGPFVLPCRRALFSSSASPAAYTASGKRWRGNRGGRLAGRRRRKQPGDSMEGGLLSYHQEVVVTVESLTNLGEGVARVQVDAPPAGGSEDVAPASRGLVVLVPGAMPGEKVKARVWQNRKSHFVADLVDVLEPSPHRIEPTCQYFGQCGGCQYQFAPVELQRVWKRQHVVDVLERIGGLCAPDVQPPVGSDHAFGYRSKLTPHHDKPDAEGNLGPIGFQVRGQRGRLVDVPQCIIATDAINERLPSFRDEVRLAAAKAVETNNARPVSDRRRLRGATLLLRDTRDGVATDSNEEVFESVAGLTFKFRAGEFFQNNPFVVPLMVDYVTEQAAAAGVSRLIDAYCGGGLFCLCAASRFEQCVGIEISELNINSATLNADLNGITNCRFVHGTAEAIFERVDFDGSDTALVIDPPRKGCSVEFLEQLFAFRPRRVVYVSCDPATQARDTAMILANGYTLRRIQPFDLFPQTRHIENVITFDLPCAS